MATLMGKSSVLWKFQYYRKCDESHFNYCLSLYTRKNLRVADGIYKRKLHFIALKNDDKDIDDFIV